MAHRYMSPSGANFEFAVLQAAAYADEQHKRYGVAVLVRGDTEVKTYADNDKTNARDWAWKNTPDGCWWVIVAWGEVIEHDTIQIFVDGDS